MPTCVENALAVDENWIPMVWLPKLKIFRAPVPELVYDERVRGILFHNCLENLYLSEDIEDDLDMLINRTVDFTMRGFSLPISHVCTARAELIAALSWFCSLPRARYWLGHGSPEQSIMDENGINYRMDMLVEEEDGSLLVLEYKSGRPRPEYSAQLVNYLHLLRKSGKRARGVLLYLDGKTLEEVAA